MVKIIAIIAALASTLLLVGATYEPDPSQVIGSECTLVGYNNESVHPNNVLVIENGPEVIRTPGIEDVANTVTNVDFTVAGDITVYVEINANSGISSFEYQLTCVPPPPVTTTTVPPTTTTEPPVTSTLPPPVTVTTPPPPVTSTTLPPTPVSPPVPATPTFTG